MQTIKAEEQKLKAQEQLNKEIEKNRYVFVEIKDKNIIQKIAKGMCSIIEWKWSKEKEKNIKERKLEAFGGQSEIKAHRIKGIK